MAEDRVRTAYVRSTVHNIITFYRDIKCKYTDRENNFIYLLHILLYMSRENTIGLLARVMFYIGMHRYSSHGCGSHPTHLIVIFVLSYIVIFIGLQLEVFEKKILKCAD